MTLKRGPSKVRQEELNPKDGTNNRGSSEYFKRDVSVISEDCHFPNIALCIILLNKYFLIGCFFTLSANGCVGKGRRLGFETKSSIRVKMISFRDSSQGNILEHKFSLADLL